ncbi:MAG: HNH endonuclease [Pseudohongiellaceae bacterium]
MQKCIYCGKTNVNFSHEHIWPAALGGDFLSEHWKTDDVCQKCNNLAGLFVDGAFIRGFFGTAERAHDGLQYLSPTNVERAISLHYMGTVENVTTTPGEVADYWTCVGANILHLRAKNGKNLSTNWGAYVGGDLMRSSRTSHAGRVLVSFTSEEPYWINIALNSIKQQFPKAEIFVTNANLDEKETRFQEMILNSDDSQVMDQFTKILDSGEHVKCKSMIDPHADYRFLIKLALGVGYKHFGPNFLSTPYAKKLRKGIWEQDRKKLKALQILGTGYLQGGSNDDIIEGLRWPGGWQLVLLDHCNRLSLMVITPSGQKMVIQVTDECEFLDNFKEKYQTGCFWLTVPAVKRAVGPISYADFLAHMTTCDKKHNGLAEIEAMRGDPTKLPPTGIKKNNVG